MAKTCRTCEARWRCIWTLRYNFNYLDTALFLRSLSKGTLKREGLSVPSLEKQKENKDLAYACLARACPDYVYEESTANGSPPLGDCVIPEPPENSPPPGDREHLGFLWTHRRSIFLVAAVTTLLWLVCK